LVHIFFKILKFRQLNNIQNIILVILLVSYTFASSISRIANQVNPFSGLIYKEVARDRLFDPLATLPNGEGANS